MANSVMNSAGIYLAHYYKNPSERYLVYVTGVSPFLSVVCAVDAKNLFAAKHAWKSALGFDSVNISFSNEPFDNIIRLTVKKKITF